MNDMLKAYYEAKVMQSLGYIDKINPVKYAEEKVKEENQRKQKENSFVELENHMIIGEYYEESENND